MPDPTYPLPGDNPWGTDLNGYLDFVASRVTDAEAEKVDKAGSIDQLSDVDVSTTTPVDLDVMTFDETENKWSPVSLQNIYAPLDNNGRIISTAQPEYYVPIYVIDAGDTVPTSVPANTIIFEREAQVQSLVPYVVGYAPASSGTEINIQVSEGLAVDEYYVVGIFCSGEPRNNTNSLEVEPITYLKSWSGGTSTWVEDAVSAQAGTVQTNIIHMRGTATIADNATITITADENRVQMGAMVIKCPNLVSSSPLDAVIEGGAANFGSTSLLALNVGPTATLAQSNELAVMALGFNPGTTAPPYNRTITPTNGWTQVGPLVIDYDASVRGIHMYYKVTSATTGVTGNALCVLANNETNMSARAQPLATYKANF